MAKNTRYRVVKAAAELGYRPNRSALSMRTGRFNAIALLQSNRLGLSYLSGHLLEAIQETLARRGMHLVLARLPDEQLTDEAYLPSVLREWSVDGFLVNYNSGLGSRLANTIEENRLPSIWLNTKRPQDCVFPDDIGAGKMITERLLALGHRRIAFFSNRPLAHHYSVQDRFDGYAAVMERAGLPTRSLFFPDIEFRKMEEGFRVTRDFLGEDRPTAIVAYETFEATRILFTAFQMGLKVPSDLSIATFHEMDTVHTGYPITAAIIPDTGMGELAVDLLLRRIGQDAERTVPACIPFETICGATIGPPPISPTARGN